MEVNGLRETLEALQRQQNELIQKVKQQVVTSAYKVHSEAVANVRVDLASVKQSGFVEFTNNGFTGKVTFSAFHAGYLEFGTGTKVVIPTDWEAEANQFKGKGNGDWKQFEKLIQSWMGRKGIDLKYTYSIMLHIYRIGLSPKPFLIPAYKKELPNFMAGLTDITQISRTI